MSFRLVPKSVTLNDLERRSGCYFCNFSEIGSIRSALRKWLKIFPNFLPQKCSSKLLVFSDISLTMIWCRERLYRGD